MNVPRREIVAALKTLIEACETWNLYHGESEDPLYRACTEAQDVINRVEAAR